MGCQDGSKCCVISIQLSWFRTNRPQPPLVTPQQSIQGCQGSNRVPAPGTGSRFHLSCDRGMSFGQERRGQSRFVQADTRLLIRPAEVLSSQEHAPDMVVSGQKHLEPSCVP